MQQRRRRSLMVSLCAVACSVAAAVSLWLPSGALRTQDKNGDGRPDVHEYYQRGALVRRESDRNFNDRVDLVQEFDPATREHTRSVVDVDFDGRADLLVLFRDGQPVFSKW